MLTGSIVVADILLPRFCHAITFECHVIAAAIAAAIFFAICFCHAAMRLLLAVAAPRQRHHVIRLELRVHMSPQPPAAFTLPMPAAPRERYDDDAKCRVCAPRRTRVLLSWSVCFHCYAMPPYA